MEVVGQNRQLVRWVDRDVCSDPVRSGKASMRAPSPKIVLLAAQGLSNDVIAVRLDTPRQVVSKWRKRFALARLPGLEEQPRGGRPALFSPQRRRSSQGPRL
jgi:hypothetical protein